jgi:hypothetical protein
MDKSLPFQRGTTYYGGDDSLLADAANDPNVVSNLGKEVASDTGTGEMNLITVQNKSGAAIQTGLCVQFTTGNSGIKVISGLGAVGKFGLPVEFQPGLDTVKNNDVCYVVSKGATACLATGGGYAAGSGAAIAAGGQVKAAAAGDIVVGSFLEDTPASDGRIRVNIGAPGAIPSP